MHFIGNLVHGGLEDADRIRVGNHKDSNLVVELRPEIIEVHLARRERLDSDRLEAGHDGARRVSAVGVVGDEYLGSLLFLSSK